MLHRSLLAVGMSMLLGVPTAWAHHAFTAEFDQVTAYIREGMAAGAPA